MTMRMLTGMSLLLLVGALVGQFAIAQDMGVANKATGTIQSVQEDHSGFALAVGEGDEQEVQQYKVSPVTQYMLNGEQATAAEALVVGAKATVTYSDDQALKVEVTTDQQEES